MGRWSWVRGGGEPRTRCAGGGLHGCAASCVRDHWAEAPWQRAAHRGCSCPALSISSELNLPCKFACYMYLRAGGAAHTNQTAYPLGTRRAALPHNVPDHPLPNRPASPL